MTPIDESVTVGSRQRTIVAIGAVIAILAIWHTFRNEIPPWARTPAALTVAIGLLAIAHWASASKAELGLSRRWMRRGFVVGGIACAILLTVLVVAAIVPATRHWFDDSRADVSLARMLVWALIQIPLGTVMLEEIAFRGVLLAMLRRLVSTPWAVAVSSVLFGVWHLTASTDNPLGTVVATTVAGVVFCVLRLRSHSLIAPMMAHIGTNSFVLVIAWVIAHT